MNRREIFRLTLATMFSVFLFAIFLFITSCALLIMAGNWLVNSISHVSENFGWSQFSVSFFLMSLATASPELTVGITSALRGVPDLSLGNIIGQNIIHFTLAVAICVFIKGAFFVQSEVVRSTAWFAGLISILPIFLVIDGQLSRLDGVVLISLFILYSSWLYQQRGEHKKKYDLSPEHGKDNHFIKKFKQFFRDFGFFIFGVGAIILSAQGIVRSSLFIADFVGLPLIFIGILAVSVGTALPEVYVSALAAKKDKGDIMAGNLFGSAVISTSLVLGIVSIISPINNIIVPTYLVGRLFLLIAVALFIYFMATDRKIDIKEATILSFVYLAFVLFQIFISLA